METIANLLTNASLENLGVSRKAVTYVIRHNIRTLHCFNRDEFTCLGVVSMRNNRMFLWVLCCSSIFFEGRFGCFDIW